MHAVTDFARSLQAFRHIDSAMAKWTSERETADAVEVYDAGWDALACAHAKAIDTVGATPATVLPDIAAKADFIATLPDFADVIDPWAMAAIKALATDLAVMSARPMQDGFAVKLRNYERAISDRENYERANKPSEDDREAYGGYEDALAPFHDAVCETAEAVLHQPAPDVGALTEKRRVFDTEQMEHLGENVGKIVRVLFDDAVRFAGGVA